MDDIIPYMKDSRYIKIEQKSVLVIYRVNQFPKNRIKSMIYNFRKATKENSFPDLYIKITNAFNFEDNEEWGIDVLAEFPPYMIRKMLDEYRPLGYLNPYFKGKVDVLPFIENKKYLLQHKTKTYFRSALTSWDNTARKAKSGGAVFHGFMPQTFELWLTDIIAESKKIHSKSEDIVFVNSWNGERVRI